jgi:ferredoxin
MHVTIDRDRCTGHGRCYALAPSVFAADADGYGTVVADGALDASAAQLAHRAERNCPERAVAVR